MTIAASGFLGGAGSRLLPFSVPFRFFAAATLFHVAAWAVLAIGADEAVGFAGGPGLPLAALHLLTLGVLSLTAIGASAQLLPVATRQPIRAVWPLHIAFWLILPGIVVLTYGMATGVVAAMESGGALTVAALGIFAVLLADNLRRAKGAGLVGAHGWVALISLAVLVALGLLMIGTYQAPILADLRAATLAHMIAAALGFMGMLALGFSYVLIPMFALSPAVDEKLGRTETAVATAAVALGVGGALFAPMLVVVAVFMGIIAAALHVYALSRALAKRMRKRLGLSFVLVRAAWALLLLTMALGAALALGLDVPGGITLFGFVLLFGWLLTFVTGVLQRIMPFLAAMHATKAGKRPPLVSELTPERPLQVHAVCHFTALALVAAGLATDNAVLVRLGALSGLVGALAFLSFAASVISRVLSRRRAAEAT